MKHPPTLAASGARCPRGWQVRVEPSQQSLLHSHIIAPEGCIHFATEHASLHHACTGATESGLRAAGEINATA